MAIEALKVSEGAASTKEGPGEVNLRKVILAASLGTLFEWYDFYIGRKRIMMAGCVLAALTYIPIYVGMKAFSNPNGLAKAVASEINWPMMILLLTIQMVYVCMVYGPIAAFLVELFPTKIRYTSMSVPYHLGNGWFGGFLPLIVTAVTASAWAKSTFGASSIYTGLIYPIAVCVMTVIVSSLYIRETKDHKIEAEISVR